ncbi:hypothetical protein [Aureibaculum marinum]|nr:hypothetical protein [Aureibaculum marinum]
MNLILKLLLYTPTQEAGEVFEQLLFPIFLIVAVYLIVRNIKKKN